MCTRGLQGPEVHRILKASAIMSLLDDVGSVDNNSKVIVLLEQQWIPSRYGTWPSRADQLNALAKTDDRALRLTQCGIWMYQEP
jgi:hypothetical protein